MEQFEVVLKSVIPENPDFHANEYKVSIVADSYSITAGYTSVIQSAVNLALEAINARQHFANLPKVTQLQLSIKIA